MPENRQHGAVILSQAEATRRMELLAVLQAALETSGIRCRLAGRRRLVLRYAHGPYEPSGMTNPQLNIFVPGGTEVATTDGLLYRLRSGAELFAEASSAAATISSMHSVSSPR